MSNPPSTMVSNTKSCVLADASGGSATSAAPSSVSCTLLPTGRTCSRVHETGTNSCAGKQVRLDDRVDDC